MLRSIEAGLKQIRMIEFILSKIKLDDMTPDLAQLCQIRLDNPEASLDEIGQMMTPPLSRSAVSRRFKKLEAIAEELKK
jgi:DNA-binding protein WhiA